MGRESLSIQDVKEVSRAAMAEVDWPRTNTLKRKKGKEDGLEFLGLGPR